jgi:hypothetical protein
MDPQGLAQCVVDRGIVVSKLLPQCLLGLGLIKMGRRCAGVTLLLLWVRDDGIRGGKDSA